MVVVRSLKSWLLVSWHHESFELSQVLQSHQEEKYSCHVMHRLPVFAWLGESKGTTLFLRLKKLSGKTSSLKSSTVSTMLYVRFPQIQFADFEFCSQPFGRFRELCCRLADFEASGSVHEMDATCHPPRGLQLRSGPQLLANDRLRWKDIVFFLRFKWFWLKNKPPVLETSWLVWVSNRAKTQDFRLKWHLNASLIEFTFSPFTNLRSWMSKEKSLYDFCKNSLMARWPHNRTRGIFLSFIRDLVEH